MLKSLLSRNGLVAGAASIGVAASLLANGSFNKVENQASGRSYTKQEVAERDGTNGKKTWVTYKGDVYDISNFIAEHPGGNFISKAAGGDVEPFWNIWSYHYTSSKVQPILDELKIGKVSNYDNTKLPDPYEDEPQRNLDAHVIFDVKPLCTETLPSFLNKYLTSAENLYVRNHAPVPNMDDVENHEIEFSAVNKESAKFFTVKSLTEKYPTATITSIIQCAGNRASDDKAVYGSNGFDGTIFEKITIGMVGNVRWGGVRLSQIIRDIYPDECLQELNSSKSIWHVILEGEDEYESSTPLSNILENSRDCLLATEMNGKPLTADHGYPVRAILPGLAGARSVKWLSSIKLSLTPSNSPWNQNYYKHADGSHIQGLPLQSIILSPVKNEVHEYIQSENIKLIEGVAYSNGVDQNDIAKVEITVDGGKSWIEASLLKDEIKPDDAIGAYHGWTRFVAKVDISKLESGKIEVASKATDSAGNEQPAVSPQQRGYLYNGWGTAQFILKK